MKLRNLGTIDLDTGEILPHHIVGWMPRPKIKENFFMAFNDAFEQLARDKHLGHQAHRVLLYIFSRLDFENYLQVTQQEIATALSIDQPNVSKQLQKIIDRGIIKRGPRIPGGGFTYKMNPAIAWKGKATNLAKARKQHLQLVRA